MSSICRGGQCRISLWSLNVLLLGLVFAAGGWPRTAEASKEGEIVAAWAQKFGDELWELGEKMTKSNEIRSKYKAYNARVEHKGNDTLIQSIVENVGRMLMRKIDAVRCILSVAEEMSEQFELNETESENYTYYSSKYSPLNGMSMEQTALYKDEKYPEIVLEEPDAYRPMQLDQDTHFYNISVNTSHSSVHVPTNVYDKLPHVQEALQWSEYLDNVFVQNYQSDPALSWQYFGSDTGIMRHFPAKAWESPGVDVYDCRKRSWYIETATCSKDIVILLDNSGSMRGFRNYIAQLTVKSVLDTFSNNDFINIYNYSETVRELVPCFNDTLVQATPENIDVFNSAVRGLKPEGYANVSIAFARAFQLLEKYREIRNCNESSTGCNQAIMLITDGVPGNLTDVFDEYNWIENGNMTRIPVRIFTYLLGKEVTNVREIQWMACLNRGYYSHIQTLDQVQSEVLKYVNVIATPLVLQGSDHPPTWTHAFKDESHSDEDGTEVRLMIAVGVPAFDRKINRQGNGTRKSARLLGVAATDVPVEDINKLTLPYKLGVNAYSFIVSNNGYVLLHPDLRPVEDGILKRNYNSIDLTEVEQFDDGVDGRQPGDTLLMLRKNLVNNAEGNITNVPVKFHFDRMRRVSQERYDYYYAPLPNTPFSMGLAIPSGYGNTLIKVGDEVRRNINLGVNMSDFFVGDNWKVHPDWVYCKYHYLEGHEFKTPEAELRHFLQKLVDPKWKWSQQYEPEPMYQHESINNDAENLNCGRKTMDANAYYCNKELMQLLVFDAKVTNASYRTWSFETEDERELIERYNATLRFVATMSGLTRWQFIFGEVEVDTDREFGDYHTTAVDETWYKTAILQHQIDPKSFVFSVPHVNDDSEEGETKVTASHAIYPRDGGIEAPGSVVGFQFSHSLMYERFMEITSKVNCVNCILPCHDDTQDCYVIDNNGYVVLSENSNDTGRYFGELEDTGPVMEHLIELGVYTQVSVYDFQAHCAEIREKKSAAPSIMTPLRLLQHGVRWMVYELFVYLSRINLWVQGIPYYDEEDDPDYNDGAGITLSPKVYRQEMIDQDEDLYFSRVIVKEYETVYRACDKVTNLTILQQHIFIKGNSQPTVTQSNCSRPFLYHRIPHTNLLMIVVDASLNNGCNVNVFSKLTEMLYPEEFPCYKLSLNDLERRRLDECFTEHPEEANVTYCGLSAHHTLTAAAAFWSIVFSFTLYMGH